MERNTVQKKIIYDALTELADHPTAEEIYERVRMSYPSVSRGTVYRVLSQMEPSGKVRRIKVGDGADHFDHRTDDHLHFHCDVCGRVYDIDEGKVSISIEINEGEGNIINGYDILFSGVCENCKNRDY